MRRTIYIILFTFLACASVLAQDAPPVEAPSFIDRVFANPTFQAALPIIIGFVIASAVSWAKRFEFIMKHPQFVAGLISVAASILTEALGMNATKAWGGVLIDSIIQLALAIGAFETVVKRLPQEQELKAKKAKRRVKKGIYQPDDKTPTAPLN